MISCFLDGGQPPNGLNLNSAMDSVLGPNLHPVPSLLSPGLAFANPLPRSGAYPKTTTYSQGPTVSHQAPMYMPAKCSPLTAHPRPLRGHPAINSLQHPPILLPTPYPQAGHPLLTLDCNLGPPHKRARTGINRGQTAFKPQC